MSGVDPPPTGPRTTGPTGPTRPDRTPPRTDGPHRATAPETTLDKAPKKKVKTSKPKAKVKFEFSSATAGATFECALTKRGKDPRSRSRAPRRPRSR